MRNIYPLQRMMNTTIKTSRELIRNNCWRRVKSMTLRIQEYNQEDSKRRIQQKVTNMTKNTMMNMMTRKMMQFLILLCNVFIDYHTKIRKLICCNILHLLRLKKTPPVKFHKRRDSFKIGLINVTLQLNKKTRDSLLSMKIDSWFLNLHLNKLESMDLTSTTKILIRSKCLRSGGMPRFEAAEN